MPSSDIKARDCERVSPCDPKVGGARNPASEGAASAGGATEKKPGDPQYIFNDKEFRSDKRTSIELLLSVWCATELDINEVNLELFVGLDTDEERRTTSGGDDFAGEVNRLEDQGKGALLVNIKRVRD